jgi:hypothetical protein
MILDAESSISIDLPEPCVCHTTTIEAEALAAGERQQELLAR